jgi:hypothetical protein
VSIQQICNEAITEVVEWLDDHPGEDPEGHAIAEIVGSHVPTMTTTLFQLVVDDNALGFEDVEVADDTTPFNVLFEAVRQRIEEAVREHLENREDDDDDEG